MTIIFSRIEMMFEMFQESLPSGLKKLCQNPKGMAKSTVSILLSSIILHYKNHIGKKGNLLLTYVFNEEG